MKPLRFFSHRAVLPFTVLLGLSYLPCCSSLRAATYYWNGKGSDDLWSTGGNWIGGFAPLATDYNTDLVFTSNNRTSPQQNLATPFVLGSLTFDSTSASFGLSGGALEFGGSRPSGNSINQNSSVACQILNALIFDRTVRIAGSGTGDLDLAGSISGPGGLTMSGSSTVFLDGANTFTGTTTVNSGGLLLDNINALARSTLSLGPGGGLVKFTTIANVGSFNIGALAGTGNLALDYVSEDMSLLLLSVGGNDASTTYAGVLSGSGSLTKVGTGVLTLTGANTFTGGTTVGGGVLNLANVNALARSTLSLRGAAGGTLTFDASVSGNAFTLGGLSGDGNLALVNNAASPATVALSVGGNNASTAYKGVISGGGSLTKVGTGTLTLSGASTYTGDTNVNAGTLAVANTNGSATGTGNVVHVQKGATLSGSGTVASLVKVEGGGTLDPGLSLAAARLTLSSGLQLARDSTLVIELGGTAAGSSYSQIRMTGGAFSLGNSTLRVTEISGFTLAVGQTFVILDNTGSEATTGIFGNATLQNSIYIDAAGNTFLVNYAANADGDGVTNDVTLRVQSVVPEPSTWALSGLGAAALGLSLHRRKARLV